MALSVFALKKLCINHWKQWIFFSPIFLFMAIHAIATESSVIQNTRRSVSWWTINKLQLYILKSKGLATEPWAAKKICAESLKCELTFVFWLLLYRQDELNVTLRYISLQRFDQTHLHPVKLTESREINQGAGYISRNSCKDTFLIPNFHPALRIWKYWNIRVGVLLKYFLSQWRWCIRKRLRLLKFVIKAYVTKLRDWLSQGLDHFVSPPSTSDQKMEKDCRWCRHF